MPRRLSLAAVAVLVVPVVVCTLLSASAFTGRGIVSALLGGDSDLVAHDGRFNILVVGADRAPGRTVVQPDSITVVSIDASTGSTAVIGVDRTTQNFDYPAGSAMASRFPEGNRCRTGCQLNYSYRYGEDNPELWPDWSDPGMGALTDAVEGYTGLDTSGYVYVELDAFVRLIDALGGVTVDVGTEVPRIGVPDEGGDQLTVAGPPIEPGVQHMDGDTALWFARSRYGGSNSDRMQRQACLQQALLVQLDPAHALSVFLSLATTTDGLRTDLSQSALSTLALLAEGAREHPLARVELTHPLVEPYQPDHAVVVAAIDAALHPQATGSGDGPASEPAAAPDEQPAPPADTTDTTGTAAAAPATAEPSTTPLCSVPAS